MLTKIFSFIILILVILQFNIQVLADENNLQNPTVRPESIYYPLYRFWEKAIEKSKFTDQSKVEYYQSLTDRRLIELNYVVKKNLLGEIQTSSERLSYYAALTKDAVKKINHKEDIEKLTKKFDADIKILEKLRDKYAANSSYWMLIQHSINSLKSYQGNLK